MSKHVTHNKFCCLIQIVVRGFCHLLLTVESTMLGCETLYVVRGLHAVIVLRVTVEHKRLFNPPPLQ